jgi:hypothetical protein
MGGDVETPRLVLRHQVHQRLEKESGPGADGVGAQLAGIGKELAAKREVRQRVKRLEAELELESGRGLRKDAGRGERLRYFGAKLLFGIFSP